MLAGLVYQINLKIQKPGEELSLIKKREMWPICTQTISFRKGLGKRKEHRERYMFRFLWSKKYRLFQNLN